MDGIFIRKGHTHRCDIYTEEAYTEKTYTEGMYLYTQRGYTHGWNIYTKGTYTEGTYTEGTYTYGGEIYKGDIHTDGIFIRKGHTRRRHTRGGHIQESVSPAASQKPIFLRCKIALSAFWESDKIVTGILGLALSAMTKASEIAYNSASSISLFFPKNMFFSFHLAVDFSSQQTAAAV